MLNHFIALVPDCISFIWRLNLAKKIADEQQIVSLFCTNSKNSVKMQKSK